MSLRKLGQSSYFQQKRMTQPQNEPLQEDEQQTKIMKTLLSEKASTAKLNQNSSASSQLLNRYKKSIKISSFKTEESFNQSPIKKTEKKDLSISKEQQYQIKKLNDWAQEKEKKVEKKRKEFYQKDGLQKKPTVNKLSKTLADQMMKKFNSVELKIDVKVQADFGDFKPLERWNPGKKVKVKVEKYEVVEDYDKEVQTNETMINKLNMEIPNNDDQHQLKKQSGQIQNYYMPIYERAKYEILLKNQKLQKQRQSEQQQIVTEPVTEKVIFLYDLECDKAKADYFWEEQKRFMQDKKDSIAKLQQDRLNALLDLEESFSFKPRINKQSIELANKTHEKKFEERIQSFVNTKQNHLEIQKELLKPQFQPQINNKSRRLAKSTDGYNSQR